MAIVTSRELLSGEGDVKKIIDLASQGGLGVIELLWSKFRKSNTAVIGFEIPVDTTQKSAGLLENVEVSLTTDIKTYVGKTGFYVDGTGRCWGYIIDTPYNRKHLMRSLKNGWYKIVDPVIRKQIEDAALEKGLPIEKVNKPDNVVKIGTSERRLLQNLEQAKRRETDAQKKIEEYKAKLEYYESKRDKPLGGVKIDVAKMEEKKQEIMKKD